VPTLETGLRDRKTKEADIGPAAVKARFALWFQVVAATQASNFSAGVWYCKVFLGRSLSWRATALSLA